MPWEDSKTIIRRFATEAFERLNAAAIGTRMRFVLLLTAISSAVFALDLTTGSNLGTAETRVAVPLHVSGGSPPYRWQVLSGKLPAGVTIRPDGPAWLRPPYATALDGIAAEAGDFRFTLRVQDSIGATASKEFQLRVSRFALITPNHLPLAVASEPYSIRLATANAEGPVAFQLQPGARLPPGVTLDAGTGELKGVPSQQGQFTIPLALSDGRLTVWRPVVLTVAPFAIETPKVLPAVTAGKPYKVILKARGGRAPHRWTANWLPYGLSLDASGAISGTTAAAPQNYRFNISATDADGRSHSKTFVMPVAGPDASMPTIDVPASARFPDLTIGQNQCLPLRARGGLPPYAITVEGLPPGLRLITAEAEFGNQPFEDALVCGSVSQPGIWQVRVSATDSSAEKLTTFRILELRSIAMDMDRPPSEVPLRAPYSATLRVSGGAGPYRWKVLGELPQGIALDPESGKLAGSTWESGLFLVRFAVTDASGLSLVRHFNLNVNSPVQFPISQDLRDLPAGLHMSAQLQATGAAPLRWSVDAGELPPGVTFAENGSLSGMPSRPGLYTFVVRASSAEAFGLRQLRVRVTPHRLLNPRPAPAHVDRPYSAALVAWGGQEPYVWSANPDTALPIGLKLASDGALHGTPEAIGNYSFEAAATDATGAQALFSVELAVLLPRPAPAPPAALRLENRAYDNAAFARAVFAGIFGVDAPVDEWTQWTASLDGGMSRAEFVEQLWARDGFAGRAELAVAAFQGFFDRAPRIGEFGSALRFRSSYESIILHLMQSAEYAAKYTGRSDATLFGAVIGNLLRRSPEADLVAHWAAKGASPQTFTALLHDAAISAAVSGRVRVALAYLTVLLRPPSEAEFDAGVTALRGGASVRDLLGALLVGAEFEKRFAGVVVRPAEYPKAFRNPLSGFRPWHGFGFRTDPYATLPHMWIPWNLLENDESDTVDKIRTVSNHLWSDYPSYNFMAVPRVILTSPREGFEPRPGIDTFWPADLTAGDYTSPRFVERLLRLITRLGEAWDNDPRVGFVEMGIIGYWGEQHDPWFANRLGLRPAIPAEVTEAIGNAFRAAFRNKLVMHRYPFDFENVPGFGIHWDMFGAMGGGFVGNDGALLSEALKTGKWADNWKWAPRGGEFGVSTVNRDFEEPSMDAVIRRQTGRLVEFARTLHWNHVGNLDWVDRGDPEIRSNLEELHRALGYRFVIEEAVYTPGVSPGGTFSLSLRVRNSGSSPLYYAWPLEVSLLDPQARRPIWTDRFDGLDLRTWLPGRTHQTDRVFTLPAGLRPGQYVLAVSILHPSGMVPAVRFANQNYFNGGRTPLGWIAVDAALPTVELNDFDDLQSDRSLYYLPPGR